MDFYRQQFIKNFNMEMVVSDLMDLIEEEKLQEYIINEFNENFTYEELYNLFKDEMNKEDLKDLLEEMGHDFIDLEDNNMKITSKQLKILKNNFANVNFIDNNKTLELEQWTNGGVDMIIYIDLDRNDLIEELYNYMNNFDIDEEIDLYRQSEDYRNAFRITESVEDFKSWVEFIEKVIKELTI